MNEFNRESELNTSEDNNSHESLLKHIRENERIHYPASWVWKNVIGSALIGFSVLALLIYVNASEGVTQYDLLGILVCALIALVFTLFGLYKLSGRAFSIRLNAFGIMITHYSKQRWHSWNDVNEIYTDINHGKAMTDLYAVIEVNTDEVISIKKYTKNSKKIVIPENYEASAHALVKEMRYFKQEYEEMNLNKHSELENEAKQDPYQMLNVIWGRLGAKNKL